MSLDRPEYQPALYRLAVVTMCVALLPIVVGAIVTTTGAGMAFADWPSSDGHNMFFYPWLKSAGDKFLEHGHRLAGIAIGLCSIALAVVLWFREPRRWVRLVGLLVLFGVILQGLLGGMRVLADDHRIAMLHGSFAALVFSLMAAVALFTSRSWVRTAPPADIHYVSHLRPWAIAIPVLIFGQFLLGGLLRHLGGALHEHIAAGIVVLLFVIAITVVTHRSGMTWLRKPAYFLLSIVILQVCLGAMSFVTKFGFAPSGYVAVSESAPQIISRTVHTIVGMLVLMTSVIYALRVFRLNNLCRDVTGLRTDTSGLVGSCSAKEGAR